MRDMSLQFLSEKAKILNLNVPFTEQELKHNYRELVFQHHPDKGGNAEKFKEIQQAYEEMREFASKNISEDAQRTVDGVLLSTLGKGLGDTVNSEPCKECTGHGWHQTVHYQFYFDKPCPVCHGDGFLHNGWMPIPCWQCLGKGGWGAHENQYTLYHTCSHCDGTGQIEIYNPVLPKGRVITNIKNEDKRTKKKYCNSCGATLSKEDKCWRCDSSIINA